MSTFNPFVAGALEESGSSSAVSITCHLESERTGTSISAVCNGQSRAKKLKNQSIQGCIVVNDLS
jgi:hypothetical protein